MRAGHSKFVKAVQVDQMARRNQRLFETTRAGYKTENSILSEVKVLTEKEIRLKKD